MNKKYFDHKLGSQQTKVTEESTKITKRILDAYIKEQPIDELRENQRIGIKLQMKSYLENDSKSVILTGEFLNKLLDVYNLNKSKFAKHIGYENANLHALIKGRRKFNSKLASIMGKVFKIEPELWLFVEAKNDLKSFNSENKLLLKGISLSEIYDK